MRGYRWWLAWRPWFVLAVWSVVVGALVLAWGGKILGGGE